MALVTGVDGCKAGWIAITLETQNGEVGHAVYPDGEALVAAAAESLVVAIDIPIGLPESGARECDRAARGLLGRPRSSSVFPAPIRAALDAHSRLQADQITRRLDGRGVGAQAWNLYARIRDIDALLRKREPLRGRFREAHPEVCFRALNGGRPMTGSKHTHAGLEERRRLIDRYFGAGRLHRVRRAHPKNRVSDDDILDAFALCWTAYRVLRNEATTLPARPPCDAVGLPMRIVY